MAAGASAFLCPYTAFAGAFRNFAAIFQAGMPF